ncbi:metallophosphoesterase family protein [Shimia sagamensis]|uniref:Calcineurin-like phosphoesterase superfamily domain-containing protein n=1 Tax=Shimia sagamensis TaxID=1566352 RepID=A0ABY1P2P6_9RHOB|nr:metallophosphoesterase family protein [Shimia sagamensis]SMP23691.1 Calcineurin-like phosphoesterase superfamily domain-containing protein [Shimia sagamensis]
MRHQDLGELLGPVLLFGGPYSNLQATEAVLAQAEALGVAKGNVICTGDVVAYCAQPAETVAAVRRAGVVVVAGNCEAQLAANALDCGCGFEAGTACDLLSAGWYAHANAEVDSEARRWMARLPDVVTFQQADKRVAVIHGGVTDVARFVFSVSPEAMFVEEIATLEVLVGAVDLVIAGHSGIAFERQVGDVRWLNAGAVGMPSHDGLQETRFAVLRDGVPEIKRLAYDVEAAHAAMQNAGLTQGYDHALLSGYWPSEDVLPQELRLPPLAKG